MNRIQQLRKQEEGERRSRWWRDGLVSALVGAFAGLVATLMYSIDSLWFVSTVSVTAGVLGAIFGERVLTFFHC